GEGSVQEQSVVGETPSLAAGLQAPAAPDAVVIAGQPRSSERLPLTRPAGGTESSQTPRWREMDSNFRFRASSDYAGVGVLRSTWAVLTLRRRAHRLRPARRCPTSSILN